jgi:hypothetical protein
MRRNPLAWPSDQTDLAVRRRFNLTDRFNLKYASSLKEGSMRSRAELYLRLVFVGL